MQSNIIDITIDSSTHEASFVDSNKALDAVLAISLGATLVARDVNNNTLALLEKIDGKIVAIHSASTEFPLGVSVNTNQQSIDLNDFAAFLPTLLTEANKVGLTVMAGEKVENGSELFVVAHSDGRTAGHVQVAGISAEATSPLMFPLAGFSVNGFGAIKAIETLSKDVKLHKLAI